MEALRAYSGGRLGWFNLGDRDLGTHLYRTSRLAEGATLSQVTAEIAARWGVGVRICPCPTTGSRPGWSSSTGGDDQSRLPGVLRRPPPRRPVRAVRFGGRRGRPAAPGVLDAIAGADRHRHLPVQPHRVHRPGAGGPGDPRRGGGPPRPDGRRVADRRRRGPQGPGRPHAHRAGPRGLRRRGGPPLGAVRRHPGDRRGRRRPGRRGRRRRDAPRGGPDGHARAGGGRRPGPGRARRRRPTARDADRPVHRDHQPDPGRRASPRSVPATSWPTSSPPGPSLQTATSWS